MQITGRITPSRSAVVVMCLAFVLGAAPATAAPKQAEASRDKVPITTTSDEARTLYLEGRDLLEKLRVTDAHQRFETAVARWPEVVWCALVTGAEDYVLRIITTDMHAFDDFLRSKLLTLNMVNDVHSRIVVRGAKDSTALPLSLISPYVS